MAYEFDWSVIPEALPFLAQGMLVSLALLAASLVGGLALGIGLALMRLSSLRWVSGSSTRWGRTSLLRGR